MELFFFFFGGGGVHLKFCEVNVCTWYGLVNVWIVEFFSWKIIQKEGFGVAVALLKSVPKCSSLIL